MQSLEGVLVIAIEQAVAAPLCTSRLAAAGARVIKIERPEGDFARGYDTAAKGESSYFTWLNQGKESACIDFKDEAGAAILCAMIEQADVLIQNLSPGALARAGFGTEQLHQVNPKLIVCNISGYGMHGEATNKRAYDLLVQAESGLISVSGSPAELGRIGVSICDIGAGVTAYGAILEALLKRQRSGCGEELSISLFDVAASWMAVPYIHAEYGTGAPQPAGLRHPSIAPYGAFACNDGRLVLISIQNEREWQRLCREVLHAPELLDDERYATNNLRVQALDALEADIAAVTHTLSAAEFQTRLQQARIAYGAINGAEDLKTHAATRLSEFHNAAGEALQLPANPVIASSAGQDRYTKSPVTGEHTDAVVKEFGRVKLC